MVNYRFVLLVSFELFVGVFSTYKFWVNQDPQNLLYTSSEHYDVTDHYACVVKCGDEARCTAAQVTMATEITQVALVTEWVKCTLLLVDPEFNSVNYYAGVNERPVLYMKLDGPVAPPVPPTTTTTTTLPTTTTIPGAWCPHIYTPDGACYLIDTNPTGSDVWGPMCMGLGFNLPLVNTPEKLAGLASVISIDIWAGARDADATNTVRFLETGEAVAMELWAPGEPLHAQGDCAAISAAEGKIFLVQCGGKTRGFACEIKPDDV